MIGRLVVLEALICIFQVCFLFFRSTGTCRYQNRANRRTIMLTLCFPVYANSLHANVCKAYRVKRPNATIFLKSTENPFPPPRWTEKAFQKKKKIIKFISKPQKIPQLTDSDHIWMMRWALEDAFGQTLIDCILGMKLKSKATLPNPWVSHTENTFAYSKCPQQN